MGYHVSDLFRPLYEKEFFLFFKGFIFYMQALFLNFTLLLLDLPAVREEVPAEAEKQKPRTFAMSDLPTTSQSSDLREVIVSKKRRANDSRKVTRIFLTAEIYSKFQVSRLDLMKKSKHENPKHENAEDGFNHAASHTSHQMFTTNNGGHLFEQATVTINITK